ncbi:putative quinol monooxygenase [Asticcacaulis sp. ZE23SCel15]|uniref:putative quinol monooxygenase n=1 Tax=Asticcacaulis sp. ZE23SCel15 TaxID=3059027 RepID=UPI00265F4CA8|nr:putative quinol monooxygenase [Asticcacaulis sp. ZE23SCel15]WKL56704.1 putative quinol monooxygenase [Asticcacaulis sp. ZE23SCel15]
MDIKTMAAVGALTLGLTLSSVGIAQAETVVRIAELEIDPAQLDAYKAAVRDEMAESVRVEPGVIAIYAVALKNNPTQLRFFEIYANDAAYRTHIASPHFKKYVEVTQPMIRARTLLETDPVQLSANPRYGAIPTAADVVTQADRATQEGEQ